jgi:hypothetical protein
MKKNDKDYINTQVLDILEITRKKRITAQDKERIRCKIITISQTVFDGK